MDDLPLPAVCILSVLGVASFLVLSLAAYRVWHRLPIIPGTDEPLPVAHSISVIVVASWIGMQLLTLVGEPVNTGRLPTVADVQLTCQFNVLLFLAILVPMTYSTVGVEAFGFHLKELRQQIADGVLGFAAAVLPVLGVWLLTLPWRSTSNSHGLLQLLEQDRSFTTLFWIVVAAVVLAPLVEELIYRVVLQTWLQRISPPREALFAVAVIFAAVHRLPDAIPLLPLALVLGYVYQQRRSFLSVVLLHMLFNAANLILAVLTIPAPTTP
ncbi:MAG: CPBP family intramembrane metalloprotease [Planctomycetaceae bacterium]|nr:CPBP family intramembrane metalloprotease [Planctomycetaceae bacterium]